MSKFLATLNVMAKSLLTLTESRFHNKMLKEYDCKTEAKVK